MDQIDSFKISKKKPTTKKKRQEKNNKNILNFILFRNNNLK